MALISVAEAAARYPLSRRQLSRLVSTGVVKGQRIGPIWAIDEGSLKRYLATERKTGPKRA